MLHPNYAWMFFNWYLDHWWMIEISSCVMDGSVNVKDLEQVLRTSLILDHYPRIDDERANELNVGNIVRKLCKIIANYYGLVNKML